MVLGVVGGALAKKATGPKSAPAATAAAVDPAVERAQAEAEAAQKANSRFANDQRRRREQGSLVSRGAPTPTLGDTGDASNPASPISGPQSMTTRSTTAKRASLISQGGPVMGSGGMGGGGRGGQRYTEAMV